jgi:hypothetical protein
MKRDSSPGKREFGQCGAMRQRLTRGRYTRIPQAMNRMSRRLGRRLQVLQRKLERLPTGEELRSRSILIFPRPFDGDEAQSVTWILFQQTGATWEKGRYPNPQIAGGLIEDSSC